MYKALLLGPSTLDYHGDGGSTVVDLLRQELDGAGARDIEVTPQRLFLGANMASHTEYLLEKHRPDAVIVLVSAAHSEEDWVVAGVRRRWPAVYRLSLKAAQRLKAVGGGGFQGAAGARGLLYKAPRWAIARIIGAEPFYPVATSIAQTKETMDVLARFEDVASVCILLPIARLNPPAEAASRLRRFRDELTAHSEKRHVPFLMRPDYHREVGYVPVESADGIHSARPTREVDARYWAALLQRFAEEAGSASAPPATTQLRAVAANP